MSRRLARNHRRRKQLRRKPTRNGSASALLSRVVSGATATRKGITAALDGAITMVAPIYGERRKNARRLGKIADAQMAGWYAATEPDEIRDGKWLGSQLNADSYLDMSLTELRDRAEELYRTFPFATGAVDGRTDNVVGTGLNPQPRIRPEEGLITKKQAAKWNRTIKYYFQIWQEHAGGRNRSLHEIQKLAHGSWRRAGDCLVAVGSKPLRNKPVPLHLDVRDGARLETPAQESGDPRQRLGIIKDADGDVTGFHVRTSHPYDSLGEFDYQRFDAEPSSSRPWALHLFEHKWPDQSRGIPWLAPITIPAKDYLDWTEAEILKAQQAAHIGVIIGVGSGTALETAAAKAGLLGSDGQVKEDWVPGEITYAKDAQDIQFLNPNHPSTTYGNFCEWQLLAMAAGLNWPFGWLVKDRRRSSYSAGRLEEIDGGYALRGDQTLLCSRALCPIYNEFVTQLVLAGLLDVPPALWARHRFRILAHRWTGAPRPFVDPDKEVKAWSKAKDENMATLAEILGIRGQDIDDVLDARENERKEERERDIVPPSYEEHDEPTDKDDKGAVVEQTEEQELVEA